jgi:hypothetical protein
VDDALLWRRVMAVLLLSIFAMIAAVSLYGMATDYEAVVPYQFALMILSIIVGSAMGILSIV